MSLLLPDTGLLIWMFVAFMIVFLILAKYGFPAITEMVDKRKAFIDDSLRTAREANEKLASIRSQSESILKATHEEQARILREAMETRRQIIDEAHNQAAIEGNKLLEHVRRQIQHEKDEALGDIRRQVAILSIAIAEKILRNELSSENNQQLMIEKFVDESLAAKRD